MTIRTALTFLSVLSFGCDPVMGVRGEVRSVPQPDVGHGVVYDSGRPVSGATLYLVCPPAEARKIAESREDGTFGFVTVGWLSTGCSVEVRATGYHTERISLRHLCVHHDFGECHWANVSAELVPTTPRAVARESAAGAKPLHRVEFTAANPKLQIFERGDQKFDLVEYVPLGGAPLQSSITDGKHRFAASFERRSPVETPDDIVVSGPTRVELEYVDRSTLRTWKRVAFISAFIVGPIIAGIGVEAEGAAKPVLIGTGIAWSLGGILFGMDMNETTDQLRARAIAVPASSPSTTTSSP